MQDVSQDWLDEVFGQQDAAQQGSGEGEQEAQGDGHSQRLQQESYGDDNQQVDEVDGVGVVSQRLPEPADFVGETLKEGQQGKDHGECVQGTGECMAGPDERGGVGGKGEGHAVPEEEHKCRQGSQAPGKKSRAVAAWLEPVVFPGVGAEEEVGYMSSQAQGLQKEDAAQGRNPGVSMEYETGCPEAEGGQEQEGEQKEGRWALRPGSLVQLLREGKGGKGEQAEEEGELPQEPVVFLLVAWTEEVVEPKVQVGRRGGNWTGEEEGAVDDDRGAEEHTEYPGSDDAQQLVFPKDGKPFFLQGQQGKVAGNEKKGGDDEYVTAEYEEVGQDAFIIADEAPVQVPGHVAEGNVEEYGQQDAESTQVVKEVQTTSS